MEHRPPSAQLSWSTLASSVPHVIEAIFRRLSPRDLLAASTVCAPWEVATAPLLSPFLALRVLRDAPGTEAGRELIPESMLDGSIRRYDEVLVTCWPKDTNPAELVRLMDVLRKLNSDCAIRCARIDDEKHRRQRLSTPRALIEFGWVLSGLQELELTAVSLRDHSNALWEKAFINLAGLRSLTLNRGHDRALRSVQTYCRGLRRLVLTKFALTRSFGELLDFPELEELVIDELDAGRNDPGPFVAASRLELNSLKHLTFLVSHLAAFDWLGSVTISAPALRSARVSDLLWQFVKIQAGDVFHELGLHVANNSDVCYDNNPDIFQSGLDTVTTATIEYRRLDRFFRINFSWLLHYCRNINTLIFEQHEPLDAEVVDATIKCIKSNRQLVQSVIFKQKPFKSRTFNLDLSDGESSERSQYFLNYVLRIWNKVRT